MVGARAGVRGAPWDAAGGQTGLLRAERVGGNSPGFLEGDGKSPVPIAARNAIDAADAEKDVQGFGGEEKWSSALQGSSGWSENQADMRQINRRKCNLIMYM